jgi:hypothetical protein
MLRGLSTGDQMATLLPYFPELIAKSSRPRAAIARDSTSGLGCHMTKAAVTLPVALSHLPDLLPITGLRRGASFNEINNSALLATAQKPPLLA